MNTVRILAFAGSLREQSYNKKLVRVAADGARAAGAEVTLLDLRDYPLPIFDEDLEAREGLPPNGRKLKDVFLSHDGLLISAAEYNSSLPAVLKNVIDWVSRPESGKPSLACFNDKVAALMAASPGQFGGLRGLFHLRAILQNINVMVLPEMRAVSKAHEAFNQDGSLKDKDLEKAVHGLAAKLVRTVRKFKAPS